MKKILITGGSQGIGLACVKRFLAEGWHVILCSRSQEKWEQSLESEISTPVPRFLEYHCCDVSREDDVHALFTRIKDQHKTLDAVINNASAAVASVGAFKAVDIGSMRQTLDNDFWSTVYCLKQALELVKEGGSIINITSVNGIRPTPGAAVYAAAKQGIESLTKTLALEALPQKIRVNSIAPGATWTPRWQHRCKHS